jgi:hypothetical protein
MIFSQHLGAFGGGTDSTFPAGTDAFAAADALLYDADGLLVFYTDGFGWADSETGTIACAQVAVESDKTG